MKTPSSTFRSNIGRLTFEQCATNKIRITNTEKFQCQLKENKIAKLTLLYELKEDGNLGFLIEQKLTYCLTDKKTASVPTKLHIKMILKEVQKAFNKHIEFTESYMPSNFRKYAKYLQSENIKSKILSKLEQIETLVKEIRELQS